jgi:DNA-binding transcriptional LysR family regulator
VRLLNRTSRRFAMTDAGEEFYRHAVVMLRDAELAENAIRHRLTEPTGTVRCTAGMATMQFAMRDVLADFLVLIRRSMSSHMQPTGTSISSARITTSRSGPIRSRSPIRLWCSGR